MASCSIGGAPRPHGAGQCGATYPAVASRAAMSLGQSVPSPRCAAIQRRTSPRYGSASGGSSGSRSTVHAGQAISRNPRRCAGAEQQHEGPSRPPDRESGSEHPDRRRHPRDERCPARRRHRPLPPGGARRGVPAARGRCLRPRAAHRRRARPGRGGRAGGVPPPLERAREFDPARGTLRSYLLARPMGARVDLVRAESARRQPRGARRPAKPPSPATTSSARSGTSRWRARPRRARPAHRRRARRDRARVLRRSHLPRGRRAARQARGHGEEPDPHRARSPAGRRCVGSGALGSVGPWLES